MKYFKEGKTYEVEEVNMDGAFVNVNGTTITDYSILSEQIDDPFMMTDGYTVFVNSDEVCYDTFEEAYNCAMNEQKDTFWLEQ